MVKYTKKEEAGPERVAELQQPWPLQSITLAKLQNFLRTRGLNPAPCREARKFLALTY